MNKAATTHNRVEWPPSRLPKDFPLTVHIRGYVKSGLGWICGKRTPAEALRIYHEKAKRKLEQKPVAIVKLAIGDEQTVEQLAERYTSVRLADAENKDIRLISFKQIDAAVAEFLEHIVSEEVPGIGGTDVAGTRICDLVPDHFSDFGQAMRKAYGDAKAAKTARLVIGMFNYADEEDWITRPVKVGRRFRELAWGKRDVFKSTPPPIEDVLKMLDWLDARIKHLTKQRARKQNSGMNLAPIRQFRLGMLLALNGGYGSSELAQLPTIVIDAAGRMIDYRRGKTGKEHIVPLWDRTCDAFRDVLADLGRMRPGDELVFRTSQGEAWVHEQAKTDADGMPITVNYVDNFNQWFSKVARACGVKRANHGFYSLKDRHCTTADEVAAETGDIHASYRLAGHELPSKGRDPYITVSEDRLRRFVEAIEHRMFTRPGVGGFGRRAPRGRRRGASPRGS